MSALKTLTWTGAAVAAAVFAFETGGIGGILLGAGALFAAAKAWGSHKQSQQEATVERIHQSQSADDRQRAREMAIQQAYGDRDTSVGWAEAEASRGVGARGR